MRGILGAIVVIWLVIGVAAAGVGPAGEDADHASLRL